MRKLIESTFVSLDGVVGSPEKWGLPYFAERWSRIKGDAYFDRINQLPKLVASKTLREATWNASIIRGDIAAEVEKLKRQPGKSIMKYGTSQLDRTLIQHKLIDEFVFSIFPVAVGGGLRLFEGIDVGKLTLKLTATKTFANGIVIHKYAATYA